MKELWTTSVLPTSKPGLRGHPRSPVNPLLSVKRWTGIYSSIQEGNTGEDVLSPPLCPLPFYRAGLCAKAWPCVVSRDAAHVSECRRRHADSQLYRTELGSRISCVLGASWSQEVKEQVLSVDCSFGLHLSLGIHKTPLFPAHDSTLFKSTHCY